jgi:DNA replication and repair protein RecF
LNTIVAHQKSCFTLFSELSSISTAHRIGLQRCKDHNHVTRIDGQDIARRSELVQLIPLQVLSPESISLLTDGSEHRRNYLDWALFHVEHSFHYHLTHYLRALKQRNALLKSGNISDISHWDAQLTQHGIVIDSHRREYVDQIRAPLSDLINSLLPDVDIEITYRGGWSNDLDLNDALINSRESDIKLKHTTVGPHRADLIVKSQGVKLSDLLSRGQLKLVVIALKLAQLSLLYDASEAMRPIILVDDLAAELDIEHRSLLLETLKMLSSQLFITTPDLSLIDCSSWSERKVFHVEHGHVKEVI